MDSEKLILESGVISRRIKNDLANTFAKRIVLVLVVIGFFILVIYSDLLPKSNCESKPYSMKELTSIAMQEQIVMPSHQSFFNRTIYFIESKQPNDNILNISPRHACAVESAAKNNPDWNITLIALNITDLNENSLFIKALRLYPNINIINTTLVEFSKGTIAEEWVSKKVIDKSKHPVVHFSDFMRLLVLHKFGGLYLDTDFIVLKSLNGFIPNWSVAETTYWVASAAMSFDSNGYGHYLTEILVREFINSYNGSQYAYNGPGLLTRVAQKLCFTTETVKMKRGKCYDFEVLPTKLFYPIGYDADRPLFDVKELNKTLDILKDAYAVHWWNGLIGSKHLKVGTQAALGVLAERHCPTVYSVTKEEFRRK